MKPLLPSLLIFALLLGGCAGSPQRPAVAAAVEEYCDSYIGYRMCIRDLNADGQADLMFFRDTNEIFMAAPEFINTPVAGLVRHKCIQVIDKSLRKTSSDVLAAQIESTVLERAQIKSTLILHYTRYIGRINRCHKPQLLEAQADDSADKDGAFGEEDFDDF